MAKQQKHKPTEAELANDPSLKWTPYQHYETVWSDAHGRLVRFVNYYMEKVCLADLDTLAPLDGLFDSLTIRRQEVTQ